MWWHWRSLPTLRRRPLGVTNPQPRTPRQTHMLSAQKGVVALAFTSSLAKAAAFYCSRSRRAPSHIILRNRSTSAVSDNTPPASVNEYELLKKSRPFRIHARLIPTNGERNSIIVSSEATKIVHFQRHAQGTLFGRFSFCFHLGSFLTWKSQRRALGGQGRTMQFTKSGRTEPASRSTCRKPIRGRTRYCCLMSQTLHSHRKGGTNAQNDGPRRVR